MCVRGSAHGMPLGCASTHFFRLGSGGLSFECGSSWEVDLRADADCGPAGRALCHPRYTLGAASREVQLWHGERELPGAAEFAHAYCDVWGVGRVENVEMRPQERAHARDAALRIHADLSPPAVLQRPPTAAAGCFTGDGSDYKGDVSVTRSGRTCQEWASSFPHEHRWASAGFPANHCRNPDHEPAPWCYTNDPTRRFELCDVPRCEQLDATDGSDRTSVLVVVLRSLSFRRARALLPRTLAALSALETSNVGTHAVVTFKGHRALDTKGSSALRALFTGMPPSSASQPTPSHYAAEAPRSFAMFPGAHGRQSLWQAFRALGYVSSFSEPACHGIGAASAGILSMEEPEPAAATGGSGASIGRQSTRLDEWRAMMASRPIGPSAEHGSPTTRRNYPHERDNTAAARLAANEWVGPAIGAAGTILNVPDGPDHVAVEQFCGLDFQLTSHLPFRVGGEAGGAREVSDLPNLSGVTSKAKARLAGPGPFSGRRTGKRGASACVGQLPAMAHALNYTHAFLSESHLYGTLPKLAVAALPPMRAREAREVDDALNRLIKGVVGAKTNTAIVLVSDRGRVTRRVGKACQSRESRALHKLDSKDSGATCLSYEAVPLLVVALPKNSSAVLSSSRDVVGHSGAPDAASALRSNGQSLAPVSLVDVHVTLRHIAQAGLAQHSADVEEIPQSKGSDAPVDEIQQSASLLRRMETRDPRSQARTMSEIKVNGSFVLARSNVSRRRVEIGGSSLLRLLHARRNCSDAHIPPSLCMPRNGFRAAARRSPMITLTVGAGNSMDGRRRRKSLLRSNSDAVHPDLTTTSNRANTSFIPLRNARNVTDDSDVAVLQRIFFCALQRAERRVRQPPALGTQNWSLEKDKQPSCELPRVEADQSLLAAARAASDQIGCDAPRFARLINASHPDSALLSLDCPAWRMPFYSLGLSPKLHKYNGRPVRLPRHVE